MHSDENPIEPEHPGHEEPSDLESKPEGDGLRGRPNLAGNTLRDRLARRGSIISQAEKQIRKIFEAHAALFSPRTAKFPRPPVSPFAAPATERWDPEAPEARRELKDGTAPPVPQVPESPAPADWSAGGAKRPFAAPATAPGAEPRHPEAPEALIQQLEEAREQCERLKARFERLKHAVKRKEETRRNSGEANAQLAEKEKQLAEVTEKASLLEHTLAQLRNVKSHPEETTSQLAQKNRELAEAHETLKVLNDTQAQLAKKEAEIEETKRNTASLAGELREAESNLRNERELLRKFKQQVKAKTEAIRRQFSQLKDKLLKTRTLLQEANGQTKKVQQDHEIEMEKAGGELDEFRSELDNQKAMQHDLELESRKKRQTLREDISKQEQLLEDTQSLLVDVSQKETIWEKSQVRKSRKRRYLRLAAVGIALLAMAGAVLLILHL